MAFFGSMPPVGPIAVLLLERGVSGRDREGRGMAFGAAVAETAYCGLAMAGVSELMKRYAVVDTIAHVVGIGVLLALGAHFARFTTSLPPSDGTLAEAELASGGRGVVLGFTISAANPVLIITWSGAIATLLSFAHLRFDLAERSVFVAAVFVGMFSWFHLFLWMLRRYRDRITLRAAQWTVRFAGWVMIGLALWGAVLFFLNRG